MTEHGSTQTKLAKLHPRRGVVMNYLEYWSERFLDPELDSTILRVLPHDDDVSTIEVEIGGAWAECYCRRYAEMKGVSISQLKKAMRKLREHKKRSISLLLQECSELESRYQELLRNHSDDE